MVARYCHERNAGGRERVTRGLELGPAPTVGQVAGGEDRLGADLARELREPARNTRRLPSSGVEIGHMKQA
jgi:hypothetical protein